jgi:SIR2-like domain
MEKPIEIAAESGSLTWLIDSREPEAHLELLARPGFIVPVIGSGITVPLGYPSGRVLRERLVALGAEAQVKPDELTDSDPRRIADVLVERGALGRDDLLGQVGGWYDVGPTGTSPTLDSLLRVPSRLLITLNYDPALERRADELEIDHERIVLSLQPDEALAALDASKRRERLVIVHAHGAADQPSTIVLDSVGYSKLLDSNAVQQFLAFTLLSNSLVFLGTTLDELHILHKLIEQRQLRKRHLLVTKAADVPAFKQRLAPATFFILIRGYPNAEDDHRELTELVESFVEPANAVAAIQSAPDAPVLPHITETPPADYLETMLVERSTPSEDDLTASFLVALGTRSALPLEHVVAAGTRTLIEGAPGSGKSTLLLMIGHHQPASVNPLRLHATRLDLVGDPKLLLPRWLQAAEAFREGELADPSRLDRELFHFLIDGLDEVPYAQQGHAAAQIVAVAGTNPAHTFTVASRRVPALDAFDRPEWTRVLQTPGPGWGASYLAAHEIEWSELMAAAPLLRDLRDLLALPFFLAHTVRLFTEGGLADAPDLLTLVGRFIDAALTEAEETLPREPTRQWLRSAAVAMALGTRTEIRLDELAGLLPEELETAGDAKDVAERLVSARLFRESGDERYAFAHRLFGEVLTTEGLRDVNPDDSRLLEVVAPTISERRSGIRNDWLVPMTLLASSCLAWRQALGHRDELAAARAVPSDASPEERERAARLIWDTYVNWRIWISDYDRESITEDSRVLARLLTAGGLEGLQDQIRHSLDDGNRETIGNAIRVLAAAGDTSIEPQLRRILETNDDYVLRRMAALGARDLRLDSLFFLIAHRAVNAVEGTEGQDAAYAALDLAQPEDLLPLALRIVRRGNDARIVLVTAIEGRIPPRDELRVLRAYATSERDATSSERQRLLALLTCLTLDGSAAEDVIFVAAAWRVADQTILRVVAQYPEAAASAVSDVVERGAAHDFELAWLLEEIPDAELRKAGASEALLATKQRVDTWREGREHAD